MDGGSTDKFHTLVPGSKSGHWTWATCSLYQKPMSPHLAVCLHIGLCVSTSGCLVAGKGSLGLRWQLCFPDSVHRAVLPPSGQQCRGKGTRTSGRSLGFCSKGAFVFCASFPLRVGLGVGLSGNLVQGHSEDSGLGFPGRLYPTEIGFGPFSWLSRIITTDTQGAEEEGIWPVWLLQLHV